MNVPRAAWIGALAVYAVGVVCVFLILHGFTGGVWGDMPLWREVVLATAWPLLALWLLWQTVI